MLAKYIIISRTVFSCGGPTQRRIRAELRMGMGLNSIARILRSLVRPQCPGPIFLMNEWINAWMNE